MPCLFHPFSHTPYISPRISLSLSPSAVADWTNWAFGPFPDFPEKADFKEGRGGKREGLRISGS